MIVWLINYCYGKVGCGFHVSKPWHRAEDPDFQHEDDYNDNNVSAYQSVLGAPLNHVRYFQVCALESL